MHIEKLTIYKVDDKEFRSRNALQEYLESKVYAFVGNKFGVIRPLHPTNFIEIMDAILDNRKELIALLDYDLPDE